MTFGRGSSRGVCQPDHLMSEPIASRTHFCVTYDQKKQKYCISDAGSKWGTFVNLRSGSKLQCGDWIRAGEAEFVVRYCGGGCSHHRHHANHKLKSLHQARQYGVGALKTNYAKLPNERDDFIDPDTSSEMGRAVELQDELALLLSSRHSIGWTSASARLCHAAALSGDLQQATGKDTPDDTVPSASSVSSGTAVPTTPLELEFISGPRMGERVVLWDRVSTLGRGEKNTLQVIDTSIANISRVHCIFEYIGDRWHIRDNKSTNGTWQRLSCILQPSRPMPLAGGECILAGTHEFEVKEVDVCPGHLCLPSVAVSMMDSVCQKSTAKFGSRELTSASKW
jgi:pSer/pThr/pTyr-binding forkhead associated (FHA) protein